MSCVQQISGVGLKPINVQWKIVRGNTSIIKIEFLENDESTVWDTSGWEYKSTVYDPINDTYDELSVIVEEGYVEIMASAYITSNWGKQYGSIVGELPFDLQVTIPQEGPDFIWTPISGTICLIGEVTTGSLL